MFSFYKIQVTGNDFIIINYIEKRLDYSFKLLSQFLCDRHFSIGADNLLIIEKSENADFKMRVFNKNGEEIKLSGNGICVLAKHVYENKLTDKTEFEVETEDGIKKVKLEIEEETVEKVEVEIGEPKFNLEDIPVIYLENNYQGKLYIENFEIYPVSIGTPHAVCFVDDISKIDIKYWGKLIENYKYFPNKINVEFAQIIDENNIKLRVWEKGIGEILSNSISACATAITAYKYKSTNSEITVDFIGGKIKVSCEKNIKFKVPVINVFNGNIVI